MKKINLKLLIFSLAVCFLAGGVGSYFTAPSIAGWYSSLNKPFFNPPNFLFGPVWSILYILMGISLYLVITTKAAPKKKTEQARGVKFFLLQLGLNTLWSILFFGMRNPLFAYVEIIFLLGAIFLTGYSFYSVNKKAGLMLIPYFLWVSFASVLNLFIVILN